MCLLTACELEKRELQSFEQRIPNKKKQQELEEERVLEAEEQRQAKEILVSSQRPNNDLLDELNNKRKSMSERIEQCVASQQPAKQGHEMQQCTLKSPELDTSELDYVIDEIPVLAATFAKEEASSAAASEPCGIGIMIAQDNRGRFVVIRMFPTVTIIITSLGVLATCRVETPVNAISLCHRASFARTNVSRGLQGSAAKSKLLNINDIIECIDGQTIKGMKPETVGNMIRGDRGSQVVLDIVSGPNQLRTRVGITRSPIEESHSAQDALTGGNTVMQPDIPIQRRRRNAERTAPPPPSVVQDELSDYDGSYAALKSQMPPAPSTPAALAAVIPGTIFTPQSGANRCGVGLGFEFQPSRGVLVLRDIDAGITSPFQLGDYLVEVNGTCVASNSMLAPSLLWGDAGTHVNLKMMRGYEAPCQIDATMVRKPSGLDSNLITMVGGGKTCGIGVVLETESSSGCFYVKRVVHGGPAFSAGVLHGDLVTHIDGKDMRTFTKEQLPSLILGQEGSVLSMRLLRAGESQFRELVVTRFLDTAKAQQSNLASSAILTFGYIESVGTPLEVDTYSQSLRADIVSALQTVAKRIEVVSVSLHCGLANVYILPDFEGGDTRSVEELVNDFVYQGSTEHSVLRQKATCKSLSKINVLGQVDPRQPPLDLEEFTALPIIQQPSETDCKTESCQDDQESPETVVLLRCTTSTATRAAAPAASTASPDGETVNKVVAQNENSVVDANLLSPKVLSVVRAARPNPHGADMSMEEQDVSPKLSPLNTSIDAEDVPTESADGLNSLHPDAAPSDVPADDTQAPNAAQQIQAEEGAGRAEGLAVNSISGSEQTVNAQTGSDEPEAGEEAATKLPLGRKLLACLGHPEVNLDASETLQAEPADDEPVPEKSGNPVTSSSQSGHEDANSEGTANAAAPEDPPTSNLVSSQERDDVASNFAEEATAGVALAEDDDVATETAGMPAVRAKSLRLVGVPADGCDDCAEVSCSEPISAPAADAQEDNKSAARVTPRDGSALQAIEELDPSFAEADSHLSVKITSTVHEAACSAEEQAMQENLMLLQATGSDAAVGSDAWADEVSLDADTHTQDAARDPEVVQAPSRPSRRVDATWHDSVPFAKEAVPARPPRGFDATGASAVPLIKPVTAPTDRCSTEEKAVDVAPEEVEELHEKFPNRIPVIVGKADFSIAPEVQGNKYLVPANITVKNFHILISKRVDALPEGMRLVLSVAGTPILNSGYRKLRNLYEAQQRSQGVLQVVYDVEEGELDISQDLDESVQMGADACYPQEGQGLKSQSTSPVKIPVQPAHTTATAIEQVTSFAHSTQGQLKNWISLDAPAENEESISPLSLLIGLGSNLQQMAMPNPTSDAAETASAANLQTSQPPAKEPATQGSAAQAGVGLKIERNVSGKGFRITGVAPDGPAGKSGVVKVNDYLIAVDDVVVRDKKTDDAANLLKGPESSKVQLTLRRGEKMHIVTLIRAAVAKQGKVKAQDKPAAAPVAAKSDKVQIFGFAF